MPLSNGERLGSYVVLGPIDSGGMGEVYRGRDLRLDRQVAIKILPEAFANHPDRLRWFERESKMLAALSHPNILAIFDVGNKGNIPYLVTEFLQGQTLRKRLQKGALPRRTVVEYGVQIARGLAAAHRREVVHCDLKPENVFITVDDQVKILDFGLAKPAQTAKQGDQAVSITADTDTTEVVVGTASYMSPEHIRGIALDARSDIFSLGTILYEMLYGEVAFHRKSQIETMNAVLNEEPVKLRESSSKLPPGWECILGRCLEKDPERRFQSASDLAFAIEKLAEQPSGPRPRKGILAWGEAIAGLVVAATLVIVGWWAASHMGKRPDPTFRQLVFGRGYIGAARFTPDGESVVYGAAFGGPLRELYSTRLDGHSSRDMGLPPADILGISGPQKGEMAEMAILLGRSNFNNWMSKGVLAVAPLSGGPQHALSPHADVCDGDIAPDGRMAIVRCGGSVETLEFPIGHKLIETSGWISNPRISPSGDAIAFLEHTLLGDDRGYVSIVDLNKRAQRLTGEWAGVDGLAWASNRELWFSASSQTEPQVLRAVDRSGRQRTILSSVTAVSLRDIANNGNVLLTSMRVSTEVAMGHRNSKSSHRLDVEDESAGIHGISDDGKAVALVYSGTAGGRDYKTYVARDDGGEPILLGDGDPTSISPDGKWILSVVPSDPSKIVLHPTDAGESKRIDLGRIQMVTGVASWSHDGTKIAFTGTENGSAPRVYLLDPVSGSTRAVTSEVSSEPLITPDGKKILVKDKSMDFVVYPITGGNPTPVEGLTADDSPLQWDATGRTIYVWFWDRTLPVKIFRLDPKTGNRDLWLEIAPIDPSGLLYGHIYISPDGQSYAYHFRRVFTDLFLAQNLH